MVFPYNRLIEYDPLPQEHVFSHKRYFQNGYIPKNFWSSQLKQMPISKVELAQIKKKKFFKDLQANVYTPESVFK